MAIVSIGKNLQNEASFILLLPSTVIENYKHVHGNFESPTSRFVREGEDCVLGLACYFSQPLATKRFFDHVGSCLVLPNRNELQNTQKHCNFMQDCGKSPKVSSTFRCRLRISRAFGFTSLPLPNLFSNGRWKMDRLTKTNSQRHKIALLQTIPANKHKYKT